MTKPKHTNAGDGWINAKFAALDKKIRELAAAKRLEAATIGKGGITVKDSGQIRVPYPSGENGILIGPYVDVTGGTAGAVFKINEENGENLIEVFRFVPGASEQYPDGFSAFSVAVDTLYGVSRGDVLLGSKNGLIYMADSGLLLSDSVNGVQIDHTTTSQASNVYIDPATYRVYRVSSSLRYKTDVVDAQVDVDAVLGLVPRAFRRKDEVAEHGDAAETYVGFIAEEAAELGLDDWVTTDEDGPESFAYSAWPVALQAVVRRQAEQIAALTARLDALEAGA